MRIHIGIIILLISSASCSSSISSLQAPEGYIIKPELSKRKLKERGLVSLSKGYKSRYYSYIPYLLSNVNDEYLEKQSDYYNIKVDTFDNLNMVCAYHNINRFGPSLSCGISTTNTTKNELKKATILAKSSSLGSLKIHTIIVDSIHSYPIRIGFKKEVSIQNPSDILKLIKNDTITITINNQNFFFVSPEFD